MVKVISQYRFVTSRTAFWNAGRSSAFLHRLASNEETELRLAQKTEQGRVFAVKTMKYTTEEEAMEIRTKKEEIKRKRRARKKGEK